jgi:hypothetical protein
VKEPPISDFFGAGTDPAVNNKLTTIKKDNQLLKIQNLQI